MLRSLAWVFALALVPTLGCTQHVESVPGDAGASDHDGGSTPPSTGPDPDTDQQAIQALQALQSSITSVYFTPWSGDPDSPPPSHVIFQQDPGVARDIFRATVELPPLETNGQGFSCGPSIVTYTLEFFSGETSVAKVTLEPTGCGLATFTNGVVLVDDGDDTYFRILAAGLGIVESDIYPYPIGSGG